MNYRGYFLAMTDGQLRRLRASRGDPARRECLVQLEEDVADAESTDKSWYLLFNCFHNSHVASPETDLSTSDLDSLDLLFLGGQQLHRADFYVMNLIQKQRVPEVAAALTRVSRDILLERYTNVNRDWFRPGDYLNTQQQFEYCWQWLSRISSFFQKHSGGAAHVLFSSQYQ